MRAIAAALLPLCLLAAVPARAGGDLAPIGPHSVTFTLKNHRFTPDTVTVPAGTRIVVTLINQDSAAEEFDSSDLRVEEDVTPKATIRFTVGPLKAGAYRFMGEGHPETAEGRMIVVGG